MSSPSWYWHRLRAMSPAELAAHGRRKVHQLSGALFSPARFSKVAPIGVGKAFPQLPSPASAPEPLRAALGRDASDILAGKWMAFGYLPLQVEDPPRWHKDYLVGMDLATRQRALKLHHRLEGKADIKLIWEPSRWYSLVRLAQAAYVLDDQRAAAACLRWLEDWANSNPPYYGWHWTSGLESGIRLIQFAWIDALLGSRRGATAQPGAAQACLRAAVLPPHLWFTWRDRSFGSSANNHLLGELAGLIIALVRWPELARWAAPLDTLQPLWEKQVLTQFASDGGNREQALNYHLFGWEFCWQARLALRAAERTLAPEVEDRLRAGVSFFLGAQVEQEQWDYGDSDNAFVTPFFLDWPKATLEWHRWMHRPDTSPGIHYWLDQPPKPSPSPAVRSGPKGWRVYTETGIAVFEDADWFLRWDLSPLGFLSTAGHGHCDALHLSIWYRGQSVVIDPGTGTYHADRAVRDYLSSWDAHNGPHPSVAALPRRMGTFLWSEHHALPRWERLSDVSIRGELGLPDGLMQRTITRLGKENGWQIDDAFYAQADAPSRETVVLWQLAPGILCNSLGDRQFELKTGRGSVRLQAAANWEMCQAWSPAPGASEPPAPAQPGGLCSPAFRKIELAPFLLLRGRVTQPGVLRTNLQPLPGAQEP